MCRLLRSVSSVAVLLTAFGVSTAFAQEAAPTVDTPPAKPEEVAPATPVTPGQIPPDIVRLKNGGMMRGTIVEATAGQRVTLQLVTGEMRTISWDETSYVGPSATAAVPPAAENVPMQRRSSTAIYLGIGALGLVPVSVLVAVAGNSMQKQCESSDAMDMFEPQADGRLVRTCGNPWLIGGVVSALVLAPLGTILIVNGAKMVPVDPRRVGFAPWSPASGAAGGTLSVAF